MSPSLEESIVFCGVDDLPFLNDEEEIQESEDKSEDEADLPDLELLPFSSEDESEDEVDLPDLELLPLSSEDESEYIELFPLSSEDESEDEVEERWYPEPSDRWAAQHRRVFLWRRDL
ncbi:MAG: hypothetical protein AB4080_17570 [Trichodesmium sp.]